MLSRKARHNFAKTIAFVLLILGAIYAGAPIIWMLLCSFKPNTEIFAYPPTFISKTFSLTAYTKILTDSV